MIIYTPQPILAHINGITLYTWGFVVMLAAIISSFLFAQKAKEFIPKNKIYPLLFYALLGGLFGARIIHVILNLRQFIGNPLSIFNFGDGGMISYGAIFFGLLFAGVYLKKNKINFFKVLNLIAPYLALGFALGRMGCFLNWCCYGIYSKLPWAIKVGNDLPRHPTQIYMLLINFIIFFILIRVNNSKKEIKSKNTFVLFLILYSLSRFFISFIKENDLITPLIFGIICGISLIFYFIQKLK